MIIRGNFNIYPGIYVDVVRQIEGVYDCALVGLWCDSKEDEEVYLVVEGEGLSISGIKHALTNGDHSIDRQAMPDFIVVQKLIRSGRQNKTDKKELRRFLQQNRQKRRSIDSY
jgi:hypothetical protein